MSRTVVVFGAGTGLGQAVAHRFGREGYRVALVARNRDRLEKLAAELAGQGVDAAAFVADLSRTPEVPDLIAQVKRHFGSIDAIEYAPITTEGFVPAASLDAATMQHYVNLYLLTPIEIVRAVLPDMLDRGDGAILLGQGVSAIHPMANLSGVGPAMAAARNYLQALHAEVADKGVYAGAIHVAGIVLGSAGHTAMTSGTLAGDLDLSHVPRIEPDEIADAFWDLLTRRDRFERQLP
ncbi:SDR family NAD(P)-dependent oxidoreductase [Winogradskya consettensis]|uniref:Short-chain dehydrogenase n=1 Tax=Winogradskya consettensis TaxID=113560 RepID=A0A919SYZ8_9ACTN|nr:SDR family NAD(P)-dependent oxidoreductase [Actinoplanes consettensis]GIM81684.1 short-chain dehydrogenase [Actinoplanes consettensis]